MLIEPGVQTPGDLLLATVYILAITLSLGHPSVKPLFLGPVPRPNTGVLLML